LPYPDNFFDATVSINTIHNLDVNGCNQAVCELIRVTKHKANIFIQVDAYNSPEEKKMFEIWMLTAKTYLQPNEWCALFENLGYKGDYFWTVIGFGE
jgi:ubiquinone/menaquinone biosynthesis C-methylase UbiE